MDAKRAKQLADESRKQREEKVRLDKESLVTSNVDLLYDHFQDEIKKAVLNGHHSTPSMEFSSDRFSDEVIREVSSRLREDGFNLAMAKHNAFQKTAFTISW